MLDVHIILARNLEIGMLMVAKMYGTITMALGKTFSSTRLLCEIAEALSSGTSGLSVAPFICYRNNFNSLPFRQHLVR